MGGILIENPDLYGLIIYIFSGLSIALSLWSLVTTVIGVSVIQKFSYLKAFINVLIPTAIVVLIGLFFFFLFGMNNLI